MYTKNCIEQSDDSVSCNANSCLNLKKRSVYAEFIDWVVILLLNVDNLFFWLSIYSL